MKYFGLYSCYMHLPFFVFVWQISNLLSHQKFYSDWLIYLIFFFASLLIFGNFIKIDNGKMKIYRLLWFLNKRNTFKINEIKKVYIRNGGQAKGASVTIEFFDENEKNIGGLMCQMLNFELRRLKNRLEKLGIEVEVDELRGNKI